MMSRTVAALYPCSAKTRRAPSRMNWRFCCLMRWRLGRTVSIAAPAFAAGLYSSMTGRQLVDNPRQTFRKPPPARPPDPARLGFGCAHGVRDGIKAVARQAGQQSALDAGDQAGSLIDQPRKECHQERGA